MNAVSDHDVMDADFTTADEPTSTALVAAPRPAMLTRLVAPPSQIVQAIAEYQRARAAILTDDDYQVTGTDRNGKPQRFVKRSGWSKLALAFGVTTRNVEGYPVVHRDENGIPTLAEAKVVARDPNGREAEGYGACSASEPRFTVQEDKWRRKSDQGEGPCTRGGNCPLHYAHAGDRNASACQKLDHDLPATAFTRARNIACSNLFGNGEVSAEEADAGGSFAVYEEPTAAAEPSAAAKPSSNRPASANQLATIAKLSRILGVEDAGYDGMPSSEATEIIQGLSRQYNDRNVQQNRRTAGNGGRHTNPPPAEAVERAERVKADVAVESQAIGAKPASANQISTIVKLSRLLDRSDEGVENLTYDEAAARIKQLSDDFNAREKAKRTNGEQVYGDRENVETVPDPEEIAL